MRIFTLASFVAALFVLAGCGESKPMRATTGALGGAVVGTAVGAPILGAAAGGTVGVATDDDD